MKALWWLLPPVAGLLFVGGRTVTRPDLKHFSAGEFGAWYPLMSADLLIKLDKFRELWGHRVDVSPVSGGVGRRDDSHSQHNVTAWGEVRAIDLFPRTEGGGYVRTVYERKRLFEVAKAAGFTGIGIYTDTQPGNLLHVDVRPGEHVATWSRVAGDYKAIAEVLV